MMRMKPAISQAREISMEPRRVVSCAAYATPKATSALADGQHQRLEHIARGPVLHEGRDARMRRFGAGRERERAVLAGAHFACELVFVGGEIHGGVLLLGGIEKLRDQLGVEGFRLDRADRERDPGAGRAGIDARHLLGERAARPAAEVLPLHQHLRGVDDHRALHQGELVLPYRKLAVGEGIFPAHVIPVVDVKRKRHHLVGPEALGEERGQPVVRGRAGVAALRGVELDQRGRVRPAVGRARGIGGVCGPGKGKRACCKNMIQVHAYSVAREASSLQGSWYDESACRSQAESAWAPAIVSSPVNCTLRLARSPAVNTVHKWMGIVFAAGIVLMVIEYHFATKKKEGFTPTDRRRILGLFWLAIFFSLLVGGVIWMSSE